MATYDVGTGTAGTLRLIVNLVSQDSVADTTTVAWELHILCGNHTSFQLSAKAWGATILGTGYSGTFTFDFRSATDVLIASGTTTVSANPDGTPVGTGVSGNIASTSTSGIGGPTTVSGTFIPPTIPRATQPTVSPTFGNTGATYAIDVSTVASSAFYHDFYYSLDGGSTYTSLFSNVPATTTSENWTPAHTLLPNSTNVTAILRVDTRSSSGGTIIGSKTVSLPLTVPASVKPAISAVSFVDAQVSSPDIPTLMGGSGRFVQGWTKLKPTVTSAGSGGSTITDNEVTQNGQITPSGTAFGLPIALSGAVPYSAIATDSRNRNSDPFVSTVAVTAYNFPNLPTPDVHRTSDAAGLIPATSGTYITIIPAASVSDLTFGAAQKNLLEWQVRIKPTGGAYTTVQAWTSTGVSGVTWTTKAIFAGYASATEYVVEVSIRDLFGKNGFDTTDTVKVLTIVVPSENVAFDFDRGLGLGINKYRQNGALDIHGDSYVDGVMHQGAGANVVIDTTNLATSATAGIIKKAVDTDLTSTDAAVTPHGLLSQLIAQAQAKLNLLINPALRTNQDGYVSGASIPIGTYAFDGIKASGVANLAWNPRAVTVGAGTGWGVLFGTSPTPLTGLTIPGLPGVTTAVRSTTRAGSDGALWSGDQVTPFGVVVVGKTYTGSIWFRSTVAMAFTPNLQFSSSVGSVTSTVTGPSVAVAANTWTRVSVSGIATAARAGVFALSTTAFSAGAFVDGTAVMITEGPILYPYFDGAMTDCSWSGTANAAGSVSYNVPNVVPTLTGTLDPNFGQMLTLNTSARVSQIVERSRVPAGTYVAVNGGTAQMRVYNNTLAPGSRPAFAVGPFPFAADGTDDVVVEFSGGGAGATIGQVRMLAGSTDFGFSLPTLGDELRECWRYFYKLTSPSSGYTMATGQAVTGTIMYWVVKFPVSMRSAPFMTFNGALQNYRPGLVSGEAISSLSAASLVTNWATEGGAANVVPGLIFQGSSATSSTVGALSMIQSNAAGNYMAFNSRIV